MSDMDDHMAVAEQEREKVMVALPQNQAQEILNYLVNCPYQQVYQLVAYLVAATSPNGGGDASGAGHDQ